MVLNLVTAEARVATAVVATMNTAMVMKEVMVKEGKEGTLLVGAAGVRATAATRLHT